MAESERLPVVDERFVRFFAEKLQPAVARVAERRREAVKRAVVTALAVFVVFLVAVYAFFSPYQEVLDEYSITYWPLLILLPLTLAVISFSIVYILSLRTMVTEFRKALLERMANYIDAGVTFETERPFGKGEIAASLLFDEKAKLVSGQDRFHCRVGGASVELSEIRVTGQKREQSGIFAVAHFNKRLDNAVAVFPPSAAIDAKALTDRLRASGFPMDPERMFVVSEDAATGGRFFTLNGGPAARPKLSRDLEEMLTFNRERLGVECLFFLRGEVMYAAFVAGHGKPEHVWACDGFDLGRCREFCLEAALCIHLAREIDADAELWGK